MYEAFFRLKDRPFAAAPTAKRYFPAAGIEAARQSLRRVIDRAEGAGFIVGPSGTGKSLLLQILADEFRNRFLPVMLGSGRISTARALLQAILFELNLPYRNLDESELRLSLVDHLSPAKFTGEGLLLLIDEAHSMSWRLLEEVRMISNVVRDGQPRVRVILAGNPRLEERFASPRLDSFSQRLAARCYLEPLSRDETAGYIRSQIQQSGGDPATVFTDDALTAVYRATDGIPRLINQVCDHGLLLASLGGVRPLPASAIEEAWSDLQQLPAPWNGNPAPKAAGTRVVEFGGLEDAGDDLPEAIPFPVAASTGRTDSSIIEVGGLSPSPEEQLSRIEAHLHDMEADYRPTSAFRPEVELVFHGGKNPFGEEFAEEEVVLDRYASLESDLFSSRPAVASREGQELADLLAPHATQPATPTVPIHSRLASASQQSSVAMAAGGTNVATEEQDDDTDLIVVEDDPPVVTRTVPAPLVRKQEYRQLFAKLRRG